MVGNPNIEQKRDLLDQTETLLREAQANIPANLALARSLVDQGYPLAETLGHASLLAQALFIYGTIYYYQGVYDEALEALNQAEKLLGPRDSSPLKLEIMNATAVLYRKLGDYATAAMLYDELHQLALQNGDRANLAFTLNGMAALQSIMGNHATALEYLEETIQILREIGDVYREAIIAGNISQQYYKLGSYEQAIIFGERGVQTLFDQGKPQDASSALLSLVDSYSAINQPEKARQLLEKIQEIATQQNLREMLATVLIRLGQYHLDKGDYPAAIDRLNQAIEQVSPEQRHPIYRVYRLLAEAHAATGDHATAYRYLQQYLEVREKVMSEESIQTLRNMEIRHKTERALQQAAEHERRTRELEDLRRQDREYFEQVTRIRDDFIRYASHDLKNPLARINLNTGLLRRAGGVNDERSERYLSNIEQATGTMLKLITDLLDLLRVEGSRMLNVAAHPLSDLMQTVRQNFIDQAQAKAIQLVLKPVDAAEVYYDATLMQRVLDNLVGNALKYTPPGGMVSLRAAMTADWLTIAVTDTGDGIDEQDLPYVFDRFYRSRRHLDSRIEGAGMGLAIVKSIVESHHGEITVQSEVGRGSEFTVRLPQMVLRQASLSPEPPRHERSKPEASSSA